MQATLDYIQRMTSMIYGIAMLVVTIGIPAVMIKYVAEFIPKGFI
ncbi:hypothetical protein ES705_07318 [subsurface metagenome]